MNVCVDPRSRPLPVPPPPSHIDIEYVATDLVPSKTSRRYRHNSFLTCTGFCAPLTPPPARAQLSLFSTSTSIEALAAIQNSFHHFASLMFFFFCFVSLSQVTLDQRPDTLSRLTCRSENRAQAYHVAYRIKLAISHSSPPRFSPSEGRR